MKRELFKRMSFKRKLLIFSILLSTVPVILLGLAASFLAGESLKKESARSHQIILKQVQDRFDNYVRSLDQISLSLAANPIIETSALYGISMETLTSSVQTKNLFLNTVVNSDQDFDISLVLPQFNAVYSHRLGMNRQIEYPFNEIIKGIQSGHEWAIKIPPNTYTNQRDLLIVRTVPLNKSSFNGILVVHLNTEELRKAIDQIQWDSEKMMVILDDQNKIVTGGSTALNAGLRLSMNDEWASSLSLHEPLPTETVLNGRVYTISSVKSDLIGWTYIVLTSAKEMNQKAAEIQRITWLFVLLIALSWGLFSIFGLNRLYSPFQRLLQKRRLKEGDTRESDLVSTLDRFMDNMQQTNDALRLQLDEQKPYLREHYLQQLLKGEFAEDEFELKGKELPLHNGSFCVGIAEIDQHLEFKNRYTFKDRVLFMYAWSKLLDELAVGSPHPMQLVSFTPRQGQLVCIIRLDEPAHSNENGFLLEFATEFRNCTREYFPFTISFALSSIRHGRDQLPQSYEEAITFMRYRWIKGTDITISHDEIDQSMNITNTQLIRMEQAVVTCIAQGDFDGAQVRMDELIKAASDFVRSQEAVCVLLSHLFGEIDNLLEQAGVGINEILGGDAIQQLYAMPSLNKLQEWMVGTVLVAIQRQMESLSLSSRKKAVQDALRFINSEIETSLSLQLLADRVKVSPSTFSKWFKEETGDHFGDYLIRLRMDKAREWLIHSDMPIKTIAERLQYATVPNFTRIFKQVVGAPPAAFRNQYRDDAK
ncbi:MAG: transcriptional regulator, AraC family [Paenibacillus sp.]|nr:transcriptional regulator, AraC family [Paenibacillus sp.]